jgi:rhodanese-related sulfurtransferase
MSKPGNLAWSGTLALVLAVMPGGGSAEARLFAQEVAPPASAPPVAFVTAEDLKAKVSAGEPVTIIDVRSSAAQADSAKSIPGAVRIKLRRLSSRLDFAPLKDLPRDREIVTFCACPADESGLRAAQILQQAGFKRVRVLKGGWQAWLAAGGPVAERSRT